MSYIKDERDKEVLNTLKRIASSLEKIEQHMCANKVNGESGGSNQEKEENVLICPKCEMKVDIGQRNLDYLERYGSGIFRCPTCGHNFGVTKEDVLGPLQKKCVCPHCNKQRILTQGELDYIEHYGLEVFLCDNCNHTFTVRKEDIINGRHL